MREKILNILGLLSQSIQRNKDLFYDAEEIWQDLCERGFSDHDIESALGFIERMSLHVPGPYWSDTIPMHRIFSDPEKRQLSRGARGFLWRLKCKGVIDHALEDEIVHKAMNLEEPAGIREIKTVAALTIFGYEHRVQVLCSGALSPSLH